MADHPSPQLVSATARGRRRAGDIDLGVARRVRRRRVELGLTLQETAELVRVPYQQLHKYETGSNRISAGRLHRIAQALDVEVGHFFADIDPAGRDRAKLDGARGQRRRLFELLRHATDIRAPKHREALCRLARDLASLGANTPDEPRVERRRPPPEPQSGPTR